MNRNQKINVLALLVAGILLGSSAEGGLIKATASSSRSDLLSAEKAIDGNWISRWQADGEGVGAWLQVTFPGPTRVGAVILVDGAGLLDNLSSVEFEFSDGSTIDYILPIAENYPGPEQPGLVPTPDGMLDRNTIVSAMPTAIGKKGEHDPKAGPHWIRFAPRSTEFIKVKVTGLVNEQLNAGFAELRWITVPDDDVQPVQILKDLPDGLNNLAFIGNGASVALASPELGEVPQASFLNDGKYGNASCWISTATDSSATIDLGRTVTIGKFRLGRDRTGQYSDRTANSILIEAAGPDGQWQTVFENRELFNIPGYTGSQSLVIDVAPVDASQVRLTFSPAGAGIDELEVFAPTSDTAGDFPRVAMLKEAPGVAPKIFYTSYGLTQGRPDEAWVLTNQSFSVTISPESGTITTLTSLDPTPVDLVSEGKGMEVYVRNIDRGWQEPFNQLMAWRRGHGIEEGKPYEEVTCIVFPEHRFTSYARLRYRMFPDRFDVQVQYKSVIDDWCRYVFGTASQLDRADWPEHRDSGGFMPTDTPYIRSYDHAYDINWEQGDWTVLVYPMGVYQRDDRLLMYGTFNLDDHIVFAPNVPSENAHPSVMTVPLGLTAGETFTFDLFFKSFSRDTSGWMEAFRWYTQNTYSYDPDFEGIPLRLTREEPATLDPGMVGAWPILRSEQVDPEELAGWKEKLLDLGVNNMLYGGWFLWVDSPDRFDIDTEYGMFSAKKWKNEIAQLKSEGFHVYTYMNNFVSAPWVGHPSTGGHLVDMDDDREREWYIDRVKSMIRTLEPSGIFWDTGWWPPMYAAGNSNYSSDSRGSTVKGWVKMQAIIRKWLHENYPDMKVIVNNMAGGSPSCFFADATMVEDGGDATNPIIVEDTRALMLAPFNYNSIFYYDMFSRVLEQEKVTRTEINEAGDLSRELRDITWTRWITHAMKSLGLGLPIHLDVASVREKFDADAEFHVTWIHFKRSEQITELASFSALANATPHIAKTHVLTTDVPDTFGAVWSNPDRLLASLFNDSGTRQTVTARIDRKLLGNLDPQTRSPIQSPIIDAEGMAVPGQSAKIKIQKDVITITADLGPGEVVLLQIGTMK